jgi:hypothetical protein
MWFPHDRPVSVFLNVREGLARDKVRGQFVARPLVRRRYWASIAIGALTLHRFTLGTVFYALLSAFVYFSPVFFLLS